MGIFKLTFLTVGTLGLAMAHFGRDEGLPADRLGLEPSIEAATIEPVSASLKTVSFIAPTTHTTDPVPAVVVAKVKPKTKITPPDPNSEVGRAMAAAREMAKTAEAEIVKVAAAAQISGTSASKFVNASAVNLRAGPSTRHGKLGRVTRGMEVLDMGVAAPGWTQIKVIETGQRGFMATKFLSASR
ncbi:SH3 domain-containing protein [Aliiroseovarius crassostreae]|uniref:SH3 domain-containing protein n=1 Tax=Aliiroseovarius crassostreae TaxID=154981 RepID=UPI0021FCA4C3|nr:SH3 domain-containing protein [Aliiroseovarius crassostreae]UWQ05118.1 SH3 domain-containing protein [Aliiroseovarius crassostreae]